MTPCLLSILDMCLAQCTIWRLFSSIIFKQVALCALSMTIESTIDRRLEPRATGNINVCAVIFKSLLWWSCFVTVFMCILFCNILCSYDKQNWHPRSPSVSYKQYLVEYHLLLESVQIESLCKVLPGVHTLTGCGFGILVVRTVDLFTYMDAYRHNIIGKGINTNFPCSPRGVWVPETLQWMILSDLDCNAS